MATARREVELLLVAHGERRQAATNRRLLAHAAQIAVQCPHILVQAAVLNGEPSFEQALQAARGRNLQRLLVYPFFISDGYIVQKTLHRRLADVAPSNMSLMRPLGLDPGLPSLLLKESLRTAQAAGFVPSRTRLLVVGHGSRLARQSAASTVRMADRLRRSAIFAAVEAAFLEEQPFLRDELKNEARPTVVAGFFSGEGLHAWQDVPAAIEESGARAVYSGPIGAHPQVACLVANAAAAELASARSPGLSSARDPCKRAQPRPW